jgi:pyrimidine operon attenuation protein/uracil phosphoribosyltransferase
LPKEILNNREIKRAITRIAHEILERNKGIENLCLIGIQRGGVVLVQRLAEEISVVEEKKIDTGFLDITFYRDDLNIKKEKPVLKETDIPFSLIDKKVILVDDVIFTGRTVRAAMDALLDFGRPAETHLAVLIDRGHREFPICADYIGKSVPTSRKELVKVNLNKESQNDSVVIL